MTEIDWNEKAKPGVLEVYVAITIENYDSQGIDTATEDIDAAIQSGESLSETEAKLFGIGAETVRYKNRTFQKIEDRASIPHCHFMRELRYRPK